ncbi:AAA family ATPase, partial [Bordetella avium]
MRLHRIALQEFRKFREPVVLDGLDAGLNIIAGPNEAGKSTYAMALRAAFLERYNTSKVADLAPYGMAGARPTVCIEFEHGGRHYALQKHFLHKARCELRIDGSRLEGEEAEQTLARLLGFEIPGRGQSKPEHAGVPGLLWITQGSGQDIAEPARHADGQVREALTQISGELASTDGDRLFAQVQEARAALLDARGGKPKGVYKAAEEAYVRLGEAREALLRERAELDADVDRLAQWRAEYERAEREAPWVALEQQAAQARAQLQALAIEQERVQRLRQEANEAARLAQALRDQAARDRRDEEELRHLHAQSQAAARELAQHNDTGARMAQARVHAEAALQSARAALEAVQEQQRLRQARDWLRQACAEEERLGAALAAVQTGESQVAALLAEWQEVRIDAQAVTALRQLQREEEALRLRLEAGATRIRHLLDAGVSLSLGQQMLQGEGETLLAEAAELSLPGLGRLIIEPGGQDLPALRRERAEVQARLEQGLTALAAGSLAQAEARLAHATQLERELAQAKQALHALAPQGGAALQAALAQARQTRERLQAQLHGADLGGEADLDARLPAAKDAVQRTTAAAQAAERQAREADAG